MHIGILQTGLVPRRLGLRHGQYPTMFARLLDRRGLTFEKFAVVNGALPDCVNACAGWLITGSAAGVYEDHAWIPPLEEFIRSAHRASVPIAGICFGHQIMAQALGGRAEKHSGGWSAGHVTYRMRGGREIVLNALHQDQVTVCPPGAEVTASSEFCPIAALDYGGKAFSLQPHPEFSDAFMRDLLNFRKGEAIPDETVEKAFTTLGGGTDSQLIADQLSDFFQRSAGRRAA
jgi:GMP synthase-like glutamine amidotransferase